jgi:hypothetical protein
MTLPGPVRAHWRAFTLGGLELVLHFAPATCPLPACLIGLTDAAVFIHTQPRNKIRVIYDVLPLLIVLPFNIGFDVEQLRLASDAKNPIEVLNHAFFDPQRHILVQEFPHQVLLVAPAQKFVKRRLIIRRFLLPPTAGMDKAI